MRRIIIIIAILFTGGYLSAQEVSHEFSVFGGGGLSALRYNPSVGKQSNRGGGEFGLGYTYSREMNSEAAWGVHTGIGIGFYGAKATIDNSDTRLVTEQLRDSEGDRFEMRTSLSGFAETQKTVMLNIPVMGKFDYNQFFGMLGFKFGVPLSGKFSSDAATLSNHAWYPEYRNTLTSQTFAGFGEFKNYTSKGSHDFGISVSLALEGGMKWSIGSNLLLYTGLYFDLGLNDVARNGNFHFVTYEAGVPANFSTNSVLSAFDEKVRFMAVGVKLRLALIK